MEDLWERFDILAGLGEEEVAAFFADRRVSEAIAEVVAREVGRHRVSGHDRGDVSQVIAELALRSLRDPVVRQRFRMYDDWRSALASQGRQAVRLLLQSSQWSGVTGRSTVLRRRAGLARTWERLAQELGRIPSRAEVIDAHNASVMVSRSDAAAQGALLTDRDWQPWEFVPLDSVDVDQIPLGESSRLDQLEWRALVRSIVVTCRARDVRDGLAAAILLGEAMEHPERGVISAAELGRRLDMSASTARRVKARVLAEAQLQLDELLG